MRKFKTPPPHPELIWSEDHHPLWLENRECREKEDGDMKTAKQFKQKYSEEMLDTIETRWRYTNITITELAKLVDIPPSDVKEYLESIGYDTEED